MKIGDACCGGKEKVQPGDLVSHVGRKSTLMCDLGESKGNVPMRKCLG